MGSEMCIRDSAFTVRLWRRSRRQQVCGSVAERKWEGTIKPRVASTPGPCLTLVVARTAESFPADCVLIPTTELRHEFTVAGLFVFFFFFFSIPDQATLSQIIRPQYTNIKKQNERASVPSVAQFPADIMEFSALMVFIGVAQDHIEVLLDVVRNVVNVLPLTPRGYSRDGMKNIG